MSEKFIIMVWENGVLQRELGTFLLDNAEFLCSIKAVQEDEELKIKARVSVGLDGELEDWQYAEIFDKYDENIADCVNFWCEIDDTYYPEWEVQIIENELAEKRLNAFLAAHKVEIDRILKEVM